MQEILPLIPAGATRISENLSVVCQDGRWTYFHGCLPVRSHQAQENRSFRMITSSFICEGVCRNVDIQEAFNVSKRSVIRGVKKFRKYGSEAFFKARKNKIRICKTLTPEKIKEAEELLSFLFYRRLAVPEKHIEAKTSRPMLQQVIGRLTNNGGKRFIHPSAVGAQSSNVRTFFEKISLFLMSACSTATQLNPVYRWTLILSEAFKEILQDALLCPGSEGAQILLPIA